MSSLLVVPVAVPLLGAALSMVLGGRRLAQQVVGIAALVAAATLLATVE